MNTTAQPTAQQISNALEAKKVHFVAECQQLTPAQRWQSFPVKLTLLNVENQDANNGEPVIEGAHSVMLSVTVDERMCPDIECVLSGSATQNDDHLFDIVNDALCKDDELGISEAITDAVRDIGFDELFTELLFNSKWTLLDDELRDSCGITTIGLNTEAECDENGVQKSFSTFVDVTLQFPDTPDCIDYVNGNEARTEFDYELVNIACNLLRDKYGNDANGRYDDDIFQLTMIAGRQVVDYENQTIEKHISYWDDNKHEEVSETIEVDVIVAKLEDGDEIPFVEQQYYNSTFYMLYSEYENRL